MNESDGYLLSLHRDLTAGMADALRKRWLSVRATGLSRECRGLYRRKLLREPYVSARLTALGDRVMRAHARQGARESGDA